MPNFEIQAGNWHPVTMFEPVKDDSFRPKPHIRHRSVPLPSTTELLLRDPPTFYVRPSVMSCQVLFHMIDLCFHISKNSITRLLNYSAASIERGRRSFCMDLNAVFLKSSHAGIELQARVGAARAPNLSLICASARSRVVIIPMAPRSSRLMTSS